uniref:Netrin n=1 Tax=Dugesia japonica TaxID=6161 RepID=E1CHK4_DUGJA|nr:netrin [Dugesia japonica]
MFIKTFVILNLSVWIHSVKVIYESQTSSCYSNGKPQQCLPSFTNIIEDVKVETTSTCGTNGPEQICRNWYDRSTTEARQYCSICDAKHRSYPPLHLTDRHIPNNQTCWFSGPLQEVSGQNEVNITVALKKSFEVYYVALQICGTLPDSIAIYKSLDFGVTWRPWQFFSQDCYRAFKMPTTNEQNSQITPTNIQEVLCVELKAPDRYNDFGQAETVLPFSTTVGRPSGPPWSQSLIEWMTMTNLKISLMRFPPVKSTPDRYKELFYHTETLPHGLPNSINYKSEPIVHFGLSDLAVGGRCKCNGHASRCLIDDNDEIRCDCHHNTEGQDCERCKSNYLDRPWHRATRQNANVCKYCDCNLHSYRCNFNHQLYVKNNFTNGGVCINCQHNTTGNNCEICQNGYYRNWTKPQEHRSACISCKCHTIGSIKPNECHKKTGQCYCKDGVTGQTCDRCKEGYKQTNSHCHV